MNNWNALSRHYGWHHAAIMASPSNEWAIDPYEWDGMGLLQMTPIESALWSDMRDEGVVMYPQYPVGGVFVDFGNPVAKVAVECDGAAYHLDKEKDAARDAKLAGLGWSVYRLTGRECKTDFDEESMESGIARQVIRLICAKHAVSRRRVNDGFTPTATAVEYMRHRPGFRTLLEGVAA